MIEFSSFFSLKMSLLINDFLGIVGEVQNVDSTVQIGLIFFSVWKHSGPKLNLIMYLFYTVTCVSFVFVFLLCQKI